MIHDLIYAKTSPLALDLRCSNSVLAKNLGLCPLHIPKAAANPHGLTQLPESWIGNLHTDTGNVLTVTGNVLTVTGLDWESPPQLPWNKELIVSPVPASEQDLGLPKWECGAAPGHGHTAGQELPLPQHTCSAAELPSTK